MPKIKGLSQTDAAIRSRKLRSDRKARLSEAVSDAVAEPSNATIGVQSPEKVAKTDQQKYHCPNCDGDVTTEMPECPVCGQTFDWPSAK